MPIFISYNHSDKKFVDLLAYQLVQRHVNVWLDRWELSVGDTILEKVQEAIDGSSALLVVLSQNSVHSEWCKKEINAGLLKELEEKRVVVLPVLLDDCDIPIFARGKLYADFRTSFDEGLSVVLEGVAKITNPSLARFKEPEFHIDHAIDWGTIDDDTIVIRLTYVEQAQGQPYTCLTLIEIFLQDEAKAAYETRSIDNDGAVARFRVVEALHDHLLEIGDVRPRLSDAFEHVMMLDYVGKVGEHYVTRIGARRLGEDTGRDILINTNNLIERTYRHEKEVLNIKD